MELCCTSLKHVDTLLLFYLFSIHPFKTSRWAPQARQRHPSTCPQQRSSAQIPKSDPLGWCGCNMPAASSTFFPPLSQATKTTKEAQQIGEERKTSHFATATNKAALFTCSGIHICFVLFSMTTGCEQRSHREEH